MLLGIVGRSIGTAEIKVSSSATLNGIPFRFVLWRNLVPQCVELFASVIDIIASGDVAQELVWIR